MQSTLHLITLFADWELPSHQNMKIRHKNCQKWREITFCLSKQTVDERKQIGESARKISRYMPKCLAAAVDVGISQ